MNHRAFRRLPAFLLLALLSSAALSSPAAHAAATETAIASRAAEVDGVKLHYLTAGHGAPVILLHGYAETSLCGGRSSLG